MSEIKTGDKVLVPRTGGGVSLGEVTWTDGDIATVEFAMGLTYRGQAVPTGYECKAGNKRIHIDKLTKVREE